MIDTKLHVKTILGFPRWTDHETYKIRRSTNTTKRYEVAAGKISICVDKNLINLQLTPLILPARASTGQYAGKKRQ